MTTCTAKHTKYNPTVEEFRCPKCNAECGEFIADDMDVEGMPAEGCDLLHVDSYLTCTKCKYDITATAFAALVVKRNNLVPCEHCKGKGFVKAKK